MATATCCPVIEFLLVANIKLPSLTYTCRTAVCSTQPRQITRIHPVPDLHVLPVLPPVRRVKPFWRLLTRIGIFLGIAFIEIHLREDELLLVGDVQQPYPILVIFADIHDLKVRVAVYISHVLFEHAFASDYWPETADVA